MHLYFAQHRHTEFFFSWKVIVDDEYKKEELEQFGPPEAQAGMRPTDVVQANVPIGSVFMDFLSLDFQDYPSFRHFVRKWGLDGFVPFSERLKDFVSRHVDRQKDGWAVVKEEMHKRLFEGIRAEIARDMQIAQEQLKRGVFTWLDEQGPEWTQGLSLQERYFYDLAFRNSPVAPLMEINLDKITLKFAPRIWPKRTPQADPLAWEELSRDPLSSVKTQGLEGYRQALARYDILQVDEYAGEDILALCYLEIKERIRRNLPVRRCQNCGHYFEPEKRSDSIYCDRMQYPRWEQKQDADGNKYSIAVPVTCKDLGPQKTYQKSLENDPERRAYRQAYRALHARLMRGEISREEFEDWKKRNRPKDMRGGG